MAEVANLGIWEVAPLPEPTESAAGRGGVAAGPSAPPPRGRGNAVLLAGEQGARRASGALAAATLMKQLYQTWLALVSRRWSPDVQCGFSEWTFFPEPLSVEG